MAKRLFTALAIICLMFSCSNDNSFKGKPVNLMGGGDRDNNYEHLGSFIKSRHSYIDTIKCSDTSGTILPPLPMDLGKTALVTVNGTVLVAAGDDTLWTYKLEEGRNVQAGMCADKEQNLYLIDNTGELLSLSDSGAVRWKYKLNHDLSKFAIFSNLIAGDDFILAGISDGYLAKISLDGKLIADFKFGISLWNIQAVDNEGNIVAVLTNSEYGKTDSVLYINTENEIEWRIGIENSRLYANPVVKDDYICVAGVKAENEIKHPRLYIISKKAKIQHECDLKYSEDISNQPKWISVSDDGYIYVVARHLGIENYFNYIFCFNKDGKQLWVRPLELNITSPVLISENILAFAGMQDITAGVFYLKRDEAGTYLGASHIKHPYMFNLFPAVNPEPVIYFSGADYTCVVRIDRPLIKKMIPW